MPTIQSVGINSPITIGVASTVQISSSPTANGALRGQISLSQSNDVFFAPNRTKEQVVAPNGASTLTLVRDPKPSLRSPRSVKIVTSVTEVGVTFPALDITLVDLRP